MADNLIVKNEQMSTQLHDHLEVENSILLKPEYETFKHLVDTLRLEVKEVLKIFIFSKIGMSTMVKSINNLPSQETTSPNYTMSREPKQTYNFRSK